MIRSRFRTVIILLVSMLIITGAGMLTSIFLDNMERRLLNQTGKTLVRQAGIGKSENEYEIDKVAGYTKDVELSIRDRYNILCSWADADKSILHEPMNGQLEQKQAVSVGKKWIDSLVKNNYILLDNYELSGLEVEYAELSTIYYSINVDKEELLSMWNISYLCGGDNRIILTIHAFTGEVWRTLATTYATNGKWQKDEYEEIIRSSYDYIFCEEESVSTDAVLEDDTVEADSENQGYLDHEDEEIFDRMKGSGKIDITNSDGWMIVQYEGEYYNSFNSYHEKKNAEKGEDTSYYMQTFSMEQSGKGYDIGFRLSKAEECYENGFYIGFEMLMLPAGLSSEIVDGFNIYSSIYDK